jgi:hypothetical protein
VLLLRQLLQITKNLPHSYLNLALVLLKGFRVVVEGNENLVVAEVSRILKQIVFYVFVLLGSFLVNDTVLFLQMKTVEL